MRLPAPADAVRGLPPLLPGGLYICDIYAGAIIIETDGSFYLFDPHCQKDAAPGTPAHVRVSTYAHDILQYVGAPGAQYTCVHLYFLPEAAEIFGLVLFPAQIANSAVVQSLAEVLHGSYNGVAQFILYICDIYAGAIIIETDGSFYLFDPHCQKDAAPGTPAHVRVSTYAHDILQYVGAPGAQYTCVHLYFLPEAFETEDPRIFMLEQPRPPRPRPPRPRPPRPRPPALPSSSPSPA